VPESIEEIAEVTHKNLFDGTIEGVKYKNEKVFSVQHHPEASPGPRDSKYIFKQFYEMI
jgi:carbamoyl-phosphate synthase small subunit